jgi:catechol 2,3-dioxygenase-like lactoylglutathione lyase family enzyme
MTALSVRFEHASTTVADVAAAERFFVDVLGATVRFRTRFAGEAQSAADDATETFDMAETFNAHSESSAILVSLDVGGSVIELFQYSAPDQLEQQPRNCDVGGHHLGFRVPDLEQAVAELRSVDGVRILGDLNWSTTAHGTTRGWVYFLTPWGLQLELSEEHLPRAFG